MRASSTSDATYQTLLDYCKAIDKEAIAVKVSQVTVLSSTDINALEQ